MGTTCPARCLLWNDAQGCRSQTGCIWVVDPQGASDPACFPTDKDVNSAMWAGVILSLLGDVLINVGMNMMKFAHNQNTARELIGEAVVHFLKQKWWWIGVVLMIAGELGNLVAYGFAPAAIVTPMGAIGVVVNCFITTAILKEELRWINLVGIVAVTGAIIVIVVFAPRSNIDINSETLMSTYVTTPEMGIYLAIFAVAFVLMLPICKRFGHRTVVILVATGSIVASLTIVTAKVFSSLVTQAIQNGIEKDWVSPVPYVSLAILVATAVGSMNFINRAMMRFGNSQVVPVYYAMFTTTSVASVGFVFREFQCVQSVVEASIFGAGIFMAAGGVFMVQLKSSGGGDLEKGENPGNAKVDAALGLETELFKGENKGTASEEGNHGESEYGVPGGKSDSEDENGERSTLGALRHEPRDDFNSERPAKTESWQENAANPPSQAKSFFRSQSSANNSKSIFRNPSSAITRFKNLTKGYGRHPEGKASFDGDCAIIEKMRCIGCHELVFGRTQNGAQVDLTNSLKRVVYANGKGEGEESALESGMSTNVCDRCMVMESGGDLGTPLYPAPETDPTYHIDAWDMGMKWFRRSAGLPPSYSLSAAGEGPSRLPSWAGSAVNGGNTCESPKAPGQEQSSCDVQSEAQTSGHAEEDVYSAAQSGGGSRPKIPSGPTMAFSTRGAHRPRPSSVPNGQTTSNQQSSVVASSTREGEDGAPGGAHEGDSHDGVRAGQTGAALRKTLESSGGSELRQADHGAPAVPASGGHEASLSLGRASADLLELRRIMDLLKVGSSEEHSTGRKEAGMQESGKGQIVDDGAAREGAREGAAKDEAEERLVRDEESRKGAGDVEMSLKAGLASAGETGTFDVPRPMLPEQRQAGRSAEQEIGELRKVLGEARASGSKEAVP